MSYISPIQKHLETQPLFTQGGFGSTLGLTENLRDPFWSAGVNFDNPAALTNLHRSFRAKKGQVSLANTFRMQINRIEAAFPGHGEEKANQGVFNAMNAAHVVKKEALQAGEVHFVGGSCAPWVNTHSGKPTEFTQQQLFDWQYDHASRVASHKPDFLQFEAIPTEEEGLPMARVGSEIFKRSGGKIPFVLGISVETGDRLYDGVKLQHYVEKVKDLPGLVAIIFNCRPEHIVREAITGLTSYWKGITGGSANGPGGPNDDDIHWNHDTRPHVIQQFAKSKAALPAISPQVKIVGVCCGGTPEVFAEVGKELASARSAAAHSNTVAAVEAPVPRTRKLQLVADNGADNNTAKCDCGQPHAPRYAFG